MSNPKQIWLSPACHEQGDGRQWCEDDVWGTCDELGCDSKSVRYVLAADYDALKARLTESEAQVKQLLAAVQENHEWHQLYDEHDGYTDSALCDTNMAALAGQQQQGEPEWPKEQCPTTGAIHDVDPSDIAATRTRDSRRVHTDDLAVDRFAVAMKSKLAAARRKGRGGWDDPERCTTVLLASMLVEHLSKGNPGTFEDVANFAMMLHQRGADPLVLANEAQEQIRGKVGQQQQGEKICTHPEGCTHRAWCGFKAERSAAIPDATELAEAAARMIYESWSEEPGYVAWAEGGNSFKQDKARAIAKRIVSALRDAKAEQPAAADEPTAHSEDGQDERAALSTALFNALESYEASRGKFSRKDQKIHAKQCELIRQHAAQLLAGQPAALAPTAVVMPARMTTIPEGKTISYAAGYEDALDAVARLNRNTVSLELLERICADALRGEFATADRSAAIRELRAILGAKP